MGSSHYHKFESIVLREKNLAYNELYLKGEGEMKLFTRSKRTNAKKVIDKHIEQLLSTAKTEEEFDSALRLMEKRQSLNKDVKLDLTPIIVAGIGFIQIICILKYEEIHVITSKALGYVARGRV